MDEEEILEEAPAKDAEGNKVLSQWEIDSLLGAFGSPEGPVAEAVIETPKNVRPYDFRRPDKFSKEQLRALQTIHESFSRIAASSLSSYLRTGVQVKLSSVEQIIYAEYLNQLASPTVINIVTAEPLPGHLILEMNLGLAFGLIDRLLGGPGKITQWARELTEIEDVLLHSLVKSLLSSLRDSWTTLRAVTMSLSDVVFNPQILQAALPGDVGVLLLFELRVGDSSNMITLFIPYTMLEPIIGKLSSQVWFSGGHKEVLHEQDEIRHQLEKVEVPLAVNLGTSTVSVRELIGLQKGNVIRLDTATHHELEMLVGGKHKFWSRPGRVGKRYGVSITRVAWEDYPRKAHEPEASLVGVGGEEG